MIYLSVLNVVVIEKKQELTEKKTKGKYHVTIMLKDIFGFAEHQEKAT